MLCIKPESAVIIYVDPKGESDVFIDQLTKNWMYVVDYAMHVQS